MGGVLVGVLCLISGGKKFLLGQAQNKVKYIIFVSLSFNGWQIQGHINTRILYSYVEFKEFSSLIFFS